MAIFIIFNRLTRRIELKAFILLHRELKSSSKLILGGVATIIEL